ncbi:hypothetical protein LUZ63_002158 [Rhynchospora breviuscula]|uniref:Homeobox-leucine zipper protein n=1 Tax=Rhynchospora breviuscula TaxID=2022672 RepID=A0A9Q0CZJ9_9POAL|nr:hypothetical protein LUZ63_002158 [Rhynchospora breviuscula]
MMNSRRLCFDSNTVPRGQVLLFGGGDPIFRGARSVIGINEGRGVKRPFFTSSDDLWEEEYYDDQTAEKKRRLTAEQVLMLERSFEEENKLEPERKNELAKKLGLQPRQIAVWFQNRRARWKTKNLEQEYDRLKSSYDALRADHESALKENDLLHAQVVALTEKLLANGVHLDEQSKAVAEATAINDQSSPPAVQLQSGARAEDLMSAGTTGSTVVDAEGTHHDDKSYFQVGVGGVQSEEDESVSDEGCNFFPESALIENQSFGDDVANFMFWDWNCNV